MRVVFLSKVDYANLGYTYAKSLNSVGVAAKSFSLKKHKFHYSESSDLYTDDYNKYIKKADVIIFTHSKFIDLGIDLSNKIVAVIHAGSDYRQGHKRINKIFNKLVDITFCGIDVLDLKPKNEVCILGAVDTELLQPVYSDFSNRKNIIIGHYPTSPKGYEIIKKVIDNIGNTIKNIEFRYCPQTVSFKDHIQRISECDIYIEDMSDNQKGIPLTSFGITSLECASLGKIVCSRFPILPVYEKLFGYCGVQITNNEIELEKKLISILSMSNSDFLELQKKTRQWVEEKHSLPVIGNWLKDQFLKIKKEI